MKFFNKQKPKKVIEKKEKKEVIKKDDLNPEKRKEIITNLVLQGDISKMNDIQRVEYYNQLCNSLGLNPLTKPFDIIPFPKQGKVVLYPNKNCAEQLRVKDSVSIYKTEKIIEDDIITIKAYAKNKYGVLDEAIASLPLMKEIKEWKNNKSVGTGEWKELNPQEKADAIMKCDTKAKRRVTFSICGLGMNEDDIEEQQRYNDVTPKKEETENILKEVKKELLPENEEKSETPDYVIIDEKKKEIKYKEPKKQVPVSNEWGIEKTEHKKSSEQIKITLPEWNSEKAKEELLAIVRPYQKQLTKEQINTFVEIKNKKNYTQDEYVQDLKYVNLIIEQIKKGVKK